MLRLFPPSRRPYAGHRTRFRPAVHALEGRALLSTMNVYHATDGPSLAAVVHTADSQTGPSKIILDRAGTYGLPATLNISADLTITGQRGDRPDLYVIKPATNMSGQVINVTGAANVTIAGVTIQGGSTTGDGGGIDVGTAGARLTLNGVVVQNNYAGGDGGGVDVADGASLTVNNSAFLNNTAGKDGGGFDFNASSQPGTVTIDGAVFSGNQAGKDGGGALVQATLPSGASSSDRPPAVSLSIAGAFFQNNTSKNDGGGLWANDVTKLTARGVVAVGNTSVQDAGALGDSVMHLNAASFALSDSYIASNQTTGPGTGTTPDAGGVCFDFLAAGDAPTPTGAVTARLTDTLFVNNSVAGAGGGAFVRDEATQTTFTATVSRNIFFGNQATLSNITSDENGAGGGLYIAGSAGSNQLTVNQNLYVNNTAATNGGGLLVRLDSGTADVSDSTFWNNQANDGGGVYVTGNTTNNTQGGTVTLSRDRLANNTATADGSGLDVDATGVANLVNDRITGNKAGTAGGGVFITNGGTVTVKQSTIVNNTAPSGPNISGSYTDLGGNNIV